MNFDTHENYSEEVQKVLLSYMLGDPNAFAVSQNIIKPDYFHPRLRKAVTYITEYASEYRTLPTAQQISATANVAVENFGPISPQHTEWYLDTIESFCQYKALELVILDGSELLAKGMGAEVEKRARDAVTISLTRDLGLSYFDNPRTRLERMRDNSNFISTSWKTLDAKLHGGFTNGGLNIFCGGSGSGKSLFLQNLGLNWAKAGLNTIYFTLELSEDLVAKRIDSMTSGYGTQDIMRKIDEVVQSVKSAGQEAGDFIIKKMPEGGTTANDLRAHLKEYEIKTGKKVGAIIVDYLDLMYPNSGKIDVSNLFTKDKFTSEEMRALAHEWGCLCVTASQLNRQSVEAEQFDHAHIAGGISKINTADNVFGIYATTAMKEKGEYELQFLKTRSSAAVGGKIRLRFNAASLVISDMAEGEETVKPQSPDSVRDALKSKVKSSLGTTPKSLGSVNVVEPQPGQTTSSALVADLIKRTRGQS